MGEWRAKRPSVGGAAEWVWLRELIGGAWNVTDLRAQATVFNSREQARLRLTRYVGGGDERRLENWRIDEPVTNRRALVEHCFKKS